MRKLTIVESYTEPNKDNLWFYGGTLKWFSGVHADEIETVFPNKNTTISAPIS